MTTGTSHRPCRVARIATLLVALVSALATSCWHPTFDPMLSASEVTVRRLGAPTEYFSIQDVQQWGMDNAWFLPPMVDLPTSGSLVSDMGDSLEFRQVWIDGINHTGSINTMIGFSVNNTHGDGYMVQSTTDGTDKAFIVASSNMGNYLDWTTYPTGPIAATLGPFGIGAVAQAMTSQVSLACFAYPAISNPQFIVYTWTGNAAPGFGATIPFNFSDASIAMTPGRLLATTASTNFLYLSCGLSDGSRAIYRWDPPFTAAEPTRFPEDYGPLIGALSDGRLLAERDGIITVLDADLQRLFKFPSGTLRFVHERYNGTEMKVVFTRTIFLKTSTHDDKGTLHVEVYEIPTANLASLAD